MAIQNGSKRITKIYHGSNLVYQDNFDWKELKSLNSSINTILYHSDEKGLTIVVLGNYISDNVYKDISIASLPTSLKNKKIANYTAKFKSYEATEPDLEISNNEVRVHYVGNVEGGTFSLKGYWELS